MSTTAVPRTAIRALVRARPSTSSRTAQRLATTKPAPRCLHQTSSPASFMSVRHRPSPSSMSAHNATRFGAVESRRTMFIQTESTPNPDVSLHSQFPLLTMPHKETHRAAIFCRKTCAKSAHATTRLTHSTVRPSSSTPTPMSYLRAFPRPSSST